MYSVHLKWRHWHVTDQPSATNLIDRLLNVPNSNRGENSMKSISSESPVSSSSFEERLVLEYLPLSSSFYIGMDWSILLWQDKLWNVWASESTHQKLGRAQIGSDRQRTSHQNNGVKKECEREQKKMRKVKEKALLLSLTHLQVYPASEEEGQGMGKLPWGKMLGKEIMA